MSSGPAPRRTPDTLVILFWVALALVVLSFVVPAGSFDVQTDADGNLQPVELSSFHVSTDGAPGTPLFRADPDAVGFLNAPFEGLTSGSRMSSAIGIMAFLLVVGGAFGIIMKTGCIDRGVRALIQRSEREPIVVLPLLFFLFSLGGAIFGMSEETIAFVILLAPIIVRLGYDGITAVLVTFVASAGRVRRELDESLQRGHRPGHCRCADPERRAVAHDHVGGFHRCGHYHHLVVGAQGLSFAGGLPGP